MLMSKGLWNEFPRSIKLSSPSSEPKEYSDVDISSTLSSSAPTMQHASSTVIVLQPKYYYFPSRLHNRCQEFSKKEKLISKYLGYWPNKVPRSYFRGSKHGLGFHTRPENFKPKKPRFDWRKLHSLPFGIFFMLHQLGYVLL
mmetsp:Transcript_36362/g.88076  ORF Transcript_36362/g.88076 Transcript_36362/m.88076 type:complete len:142 (+) Transcript_36362:7541-7966(+)